jgi:hypothetical protein
MHTLVHEPGHGVFGLRHTFSAYNQFMQNKSSTLNVMDYPSSGKELTSNELLKYQWDLTHDNTQEYSDKESKSEAEDKGEETNQTSLNVPVWVNAMQATTPITFLAPSGFPITIKDKLTECLIVTEEGNVVYIDGVGKIVENAATLANKGVTLSFKTPALLGFKIQNSKNEVETYLGVVSSLGEGEDYFKGYWNIEKGIYYQDDVTSDIATKGKYNVYYWAGGSYKTFDQWSKKEVCINPLDNPAAKLYNDKGYQAAGYITADPLTYINIDCDDITYMDLSSLPYTLSYQKNYILITYTRKNGQILKLRCQYDATSKSNKYELFTIKGWTPYTTPQFSDATFKNLYQICVASKRDIISLIPIGGDIINGIGYYLEDDKLNAALCFAFAAFPAFDAAKTITVKIAKEAALYEKEAYELTLSSYNTLRSIAKSSNATLTNESKRLLPKILSENGNYASTIEKLSNKVTGTELGTTLNKIDALGINDGKTFLSDISISTDGGSYLAKNLDKINENTIEAWNVLKNAGETQAIRTSEKSLTNINTYLSSNKNVTSEQLVKDIENAGGYEKWAVNLAKEADEVGKYTTKIRWGIQDIDVRPFEKGYWGKRVSQTNPRVDAFELKINPNNESFYLPHPEGGYVQYENIVNATVQDGKLVMDQSSIYHVLDKPEFLTTKSILEPAQRQLAAAKAAGYKVEWLVSDEKAVQQLTQYFKDKNIDITVKLLKE